MSGTSLNALLFLIGSIFDLYILILIIRLFLAWAGADYSHPVTQFIIKLTSFIVKPLRRFLPNVYGIELSTLVLIIFVAALKFLVIFLLSFGFPNLLGLFILALVDSIKLILETLIFAIFLQWLVSYLQPGSPINHVLTKLTWPIMRPLQSILPRIAGIDFSWVVAIIILLLLIIILVDPLLALGLGIAIG